MAGEDKTLKILLQIRSDVADLQKVVGGLKEVRTVTDEAAKSGFGLKQAFEFAGANEVLHRLVETLKEVPRQFVEAIKQGVEFNAELQRVQTSIAGIFRQQAPDKFPTFEKAKDAAAETIDLLKKKANDLGVAYTDMFETYQHAQALLSAGGISNVQEQIAVIALLNRAMQSLGVNATAAARDISDLLQGGGKAAQTLGVPRLASLVHMSTEEFLQWIEASKQAGTLAQDLQTKLGGLAASMERSGQTFDAQITRMENAIFDLKQAAAGPIMEPLTQAIEAFTRALQSADAKTAASNLGKFMREFAADALMASAGWDAIAKWTLETDKNLLDALPGAKAFASLFGGAAGGKPSGDTFDLLEFLESGLNKQREKGNQLEVGKSKILGDQTAQLQLQQQIEDELNLTRARTSGDTEAVAQERATMAADKAVAAMEEKRVKQLEINGELLNEDQVWKAIYKATYDQAKAVESGKTSHEQITALLREQEAILQNIHQQEQLIAQNPFLSADAKDAQLANLYLREQTILLGEIAKVKAKIKEIEAIGGPNEQAEVAELNQKLQGLEFTLTSVTQKFATTGFMGGLQKDLANWVNSFGAASHQIAATIEGSINATLQATNQLLIDAAFRTGDWKQTVVGLERQLLSMFLTMLEQMALQQAASLLGITTTTSAQVASGGAIAAAHAPAAAATSISSYGTAALIGEVLAIAAIVAIMAALGGGFKRGGFTGAGHEDEIAGPAHKGEFYFSKRETESIGLSNLYALKHSAPRFGVGGRVYENAGYFRGPATLPGDPGGIEPDILMGNYGYVGHSLPRPGEPSVQVKNWGLTGSAPYWNRPSPGGYSPTPNYIAQFGGNLGLGAFSPWSGLGYGTRPDLTGPAQALVGGASGLQPNTARGTWEILNPNTGFFETVGHFGESIATVQARAAAVAASGSGAGGGFAGGAGFSHSADYIGYGPSSRSIADLRVMADQARSGGGNNMGTTGDPGHTIFNLTGNRFVGKIVDGTLVHVLHPYGRADGGRIPGTASRADNILSWLSPGEHVIDAFTTAKMDRTFGADWPAHMASMRADVPSLRLASGGRVGVTAGPGGGSQQLAGTGDVHVFIFDDLRKAMRAYEESPAARKTFRRNGRNYL